jgi:hypothetical protein
MADLAARVNLLLDERIGATGRELDTFQDVVEETRGPLNVRHVVSLLQHVHFRECSRCDALVLAEQSVEFLASLDEPKVEIFRSAKSLQRAVLKEMTKRSLLRRAQWAHQLIQVHFDVFLLFSNIGFFWFLEEVVLKKPYVNNLNTWQKMLALETRVVWLPGFHLVLYRAFPQATANRQ